MVASMTMRQLMMIFTLLIVVLIAFVLIAQASGMTLPLKDQLDKLIASIFGGGTK